MLPLAIPSSNPFLPHWLLPLGSHDFFSGEVAAVHMDTEIQDEKEEMDIGKAKLFTFCAVAREYWSLGESIGSHGFTKGKLG